MNKHGKIEKPKQLNLKDGETYALAAELARLHGDTLSGAVKAALQEKLERDRRGLTKEERLARMMSVVERYWARPVKDTRTADEILGYDENGLPT
jgi:antitoxin VapB